MSLLGHNKQILSIRGILIILILGTSLSVYAVQHIIIGPYYQQPITLTIVVSFAVMIWFFKKAWSDTWDFMSKNPIIVFVIAMWTVCIQYYTYQSKSEISRVNLHVLSDKIDLFTVYWYLFAGVFLCVFIIWLIVQFKRTLGMIYKELGLREKKIYISIIAVVFLILCVLYLSNPLMYYQMDNVYSIDSKWVWQGIFSDPNYYDMRHPIMAELLFPIWSGINGILKFLGVTQLRLPLTLLFIQIINIVCLLTVGVLVGKLVNNLNAKILYFISMPTFLYVLSIEKYQIPLVFLVLYVYDSLNSRENIDVELIATAGFNPVFSLIWLNELFDNNQSFISNIRKLVKYAVSMVLVLLCTGRGLIFYFDSLIDQFNNQTISFRTTYYTISERIIGVFNLFTNCIIALDSKSTEPYIWPGDGSTLKISYTWTDVNASIPIFGIAIIGITLYGIWKGRKEKIYRICAAWLVMPFFMFLIMNLVPFETPLFSVFFSWALIPLFVKGIDGLTDILKVSRKTVYGIIYGIVGSINIATIVNIILFLYNIRNSQL